MPPKPPNRRMPSQQGLSRVLRAVHTGSVNDYAAYAVAGMLAVIAVLTLTRYAPMRPRVAAAQAWIRSGGQRILEAGVDRQQPIGSHCCHGPQHGRGPHHEPQLDTGRGGLLLRQ